MSDEQRRYMAYMLRLWQASTNEGRTWRASLESPHTGERQAFVDLKTLFAFLEKETTAHFSLDAEIDIQPHDYYSE